MTRYITLSVAVVSIPFANSGLVEDGCKTAYSASITDSTGSRLRIKPEMISDVGFVRIKLTALRNVLRNLEKLCRIDAADINKVSCYLCDDSISHIWHSGELASVGKGARTINPYDLGIPNADIWSEIIALCSQLNMQLNFPPKSDMLSVLSRINEAHARSYLENGNDHDPNHVDFSRELASIQKRKRHRVSKNREEGGDQ